MNLRLPLKRINAFLISFSFFLFSIFIGFPQTDENKSLKEQVKSEIISIDNVSEESEKISRLLSDYRNVLVQNKIVLEIDSLLTVEYDSIVIRRDSVISKLDKESIRVLKVQNVAWKNYNSRLKEFQETLKNRSEKVIEVNDNLISELQKWEETKNSITTSENSKEILSNLDRIIATLQEVINIATSRIKALYLTEKKLTELVLLSEEVISEIKTAELKIKKDYFIFDSQPIWKKDSINSKKKHNTEVNTISLKSQLLNNQKIVKEFYKANKKTAAIQVLFILFIFLLLITVKKKWKIKLDELKNPVEIQAKIVLKNYFFATLVAGLLLSAFFYEALIPAVIEFYVILILCGTIILLPKLTHPKFRIFLASTLVVYLMYLTQVYVTHDVELIRIFALFLIVTLFVTLFFGRKLVKKYPDNFVRINKIFITASSLYMLLLISAFFVNIVGMVALSAFIFYGIMSSVILMFVLYLSSKIITSIILLIFKMRQSYGLEAVSTIVHATHKRIQPILFWTAMFVWILFTLKGFGVYSFFIDQVHKLLDIHWEVGEMTISLGGILSFASIFIITILIAKLVASIFLDDWMIKILPKGVAPAISLLLRIGLISAGLYIGFSAAGLDLSKLGFVIGTLGVGIGFGLQNVVLNFIAGLILSFERPINIGDTIEVDNEFGVVTNIGIRSSNIRTYDGYEAIIPNGDLISKKVVNWTLSNRDRKSKVLFKTAPDANPEEILELFNTIGSNHPDVYKNPEPFTYFKGFDDDGNLIFELWYWTTFSDALNSKHEISLSIFSKLREIGIQAPVPTRRIIKD